MSRPLARLLPVSLCLLAVAAAAHAAGARFWEVGTLTDFLKGDATSLSIDLHGRLLLGPSLSPVVDPESPVLWGGLVAPDGTLFVGSGNDGKVLKVTPDGKLSAFYDSTELEVHALALAPGGGLYVGTSPEGRVYKVEADGTAAPFFDPEDKYIWAIAGLPDGTLYVATGDKGLIYKVTPDGQGSVFYRTKATHVRSLLLTSNGDLLAGTESPGRVFRINAAGNGFLVLDSNLQEVSALRPGPGGIVYVAALTGKSSDERAPILPVMPETGRPSPVATVTAEVTGMTIVDVGPPSSTGGSRDVGRTVGKGAVYRIQPDGVWDVVWTSADDTPYDVALDNDNALLVATGGKGKLYRVAGEPAETTLLVRAPVQQVTALLQSANGLLLATANPGKLFRISGAPATAGSYESDVRDAESVATWGTISWRGSVPKGGDVRLFTRTGNSAAPDETWSSWSAAYHRGEGEQISSPKARYLQWKLEMSGANGASPIITSVTIAYQQRNQRPEITSITVHPPGVVFQKPFSSGEAEIAGYDGPPITQRAAAPMGSPGTPLLGRRSYQKGLQTFVWKAQDANDDELSFDIQYRREGDTTWKVLKRNLSDPLFVWDTTSVPNGTYVLKVLASDAPANPPGAALVAERESDTFDVDNAPPVIGITSVTRDNNRTTVRFTVKDSDSPVQRVEYSLEADRWRPIYPKDGIADSRTEEFELVLDQDLGDRQVILRAFDTMNNVATTRAEAPPPPPPAPPKR
jgi:hypothetical protein